LGQISPSSGTIKVNGRKPNDPLNNIPGIGVGFMPQVNQTNLNCNLYNNFLFFTQSIPGNSTLSRILNKRNTSILRENIWFEKGLQANQNQILDSIS